MIDFRVARLQNLLLCNCTKVLKILFIDNVLYFSILRCVCFEQSVPKRQQEIMVNYVTC